MTATLVGVPTAVVVNATEALVAPAGTVMSAGALTAELSLLSGTTNPPPGAGALNQTVIDPPSTPPSTDDGEADIAVTR
jgi:hypothetical protein